MKPALTLPATAHIAAILQNYPVSKEHLLGPSKAHRHVVARRELFIRLMCTPFGFADDGSPVYRSLPQAGKIVGKRDHTTVLYSIRIYAREHFGTRPKASVAEIRSAWIAAMAEPEHNSLEELAA